MQQVVITGRVGQDPEMKYFESGKVKTSFSLAVKSWDSGTKQQITSWFNIECWDKLAETSGEHAKKGKVITVEGEIKANTFTGSDGKEKTKWIVNANKFGFDGAFTTLNGIIEKFETRFTANNKKIHHIKLKDCDIPITYYNEEEPINGSFITCLCELSINEYKPYAKALKIDSGELKKAIPKFSEHEDLIGEEEIPF